MKQPPRYIYIRSPGRKRNFFLLSGIWICVTFFCIWLVQTSLSPNLPTAEQPIRLYSNQCRQDLRLTLLQAIERSNQSIYLVMFGLSDSAILNVLAKKMKQNIPLTLFYDPKGSPKIEKKLPQGDIHPVLLSGLMHRKILILDEQTVFLGSANMTQASLRMHDNLVIGVRDKELAQFLKSHSPSGTGHFRHTIGGQLIEVWLLPDPRGHALVDLKKKIRSAQRLIRIALFTFTHPQLLEELIQAHRRGVKVSVIVDTHSAFGASAQTLDQLKKAGIPVRISSGVQLLHHKFLYIDEQMLLTGSANWTKAAFYKNSDCFFILHSLTSEQKHFMNLLWKGLEVNSTE